MPKKGNSSIRFIVYVGVVVLITAILYFAVIQPGFFKNEEEINYTVYKYYPGDVQLLNVKSYSKDKYVTIEYDTQNNNPYNADISQVLAGYDSNGKFVRYNGPGGGLITAGGKERGSMSVLDPKKNITSFKVFIFDNKYFVYTSNLTYKTEDPSDNTGIKVLYHYPDNSGSEPNHPKDFLVIGEIQNNYGFNVIEVKVNITGYDTNGNVVGEGENKVAVPIIPPGKFSPFIVYLKDPDKRIVKYDLIIKYKSE